MDDSFWNILSLLQEVGRLAGGGGGSTRHYSIGCGSLRASLCHWRPLLAQTLCAVPEGYSEGGRRWVPPSRCPPSSCLTPVRHVAAGEGVRAAKGGQVLFATRSQQTSVLEALTLEEEKGCLQIPFPCPSDVGDASEPHHSWEQRGLMGPCGSMWPLGEGHRSVLVPDACGLDRGGPPSGGPGVAVLRKKGP